MKKNKTVHQLSQSVTHSTVFFLLLSVTNWMIERTNEWMNEWPNKHVDVIQFKCLWSVKLLLIVCFMEWCFSLIDVLFYNEYQNNIYIFLIKHISNIAKYYYSLKQSLVFLTPWLTFSVSNYPSEIILICWFITLHWYNMTLIIQVIWINLNIIKIKFILPKLLDMGYVEIAI